MPGDRLCSAHLLNHRHKDHKVSSQLHSQSNNRIHSNGSVLFTPTPANLSEGNHQRLEDPRSILSDIGDLCEVNHSHSSSFGRFHSAIPRFLDSTHKGRQAQRQVLLQACTEGPHSVEDLNLGSLRSILISEYHQELREDSRQKALEFRRHCFRQRLYQANDGESEFMDFPEVASEFKDVLKIVANVAADDRDEV